MTNVCPRCQGPLVSKEGEEDSGTSRATPDRDIDVCGPCVLDEAVRYAVGLGVARVATWPVKGPHMTWADCALPTRVTLDAASKVLGINPQDGQDLARIDGYPISVLDADEDGYQVTTVELIRHAGLGRVRDVLRDQG